MKFRNLLGYVVGSAIFLVFFPYLIRLISQKFAFIIFENQILPIVFGAPFLALGAIYIILSNIQMKRIGKGNPADGFNAAIGERTKNLMTEGIYKHTRNPMLFGVFALYIGIACLQIHTPHRFSRDFYRLYEPVCEKLRDLGCFWILATNTSGICVKRR